MVTTIQISNELKNKLSDIKKNESYEDVIKKLLKEYEKNIVAEQMKDYGKKYGKESLKELKEWEETDLNW
ncbi:MAG: antitoxin VapB family protein [Candidatus Woesearchaeota archaeon]